MAELGVPASGRIPAGELADEGRVIGRLSDIGWGTRLRELVSGDDVPVPPDVLDACVTVLAGWSWAARPVGVVGVGSRTRPHQLAHLARRIAEIGRLPLLGTADAGRALARQPSANSAQRLAAVWDGFTVPDLAASDGPVLLVDDVIDSGWTATVVARLLRRAGASAVLPFALALAAGPHVMPADLVMKALNAVHRALIKVAPRRFGHEALGMPVLELTTVGRRSGRPRSVMLTSPVRDGEAIVVVASRVGDDRHPDWLLNLRAQPTRRGGAASGSPPPDGRPSRGRGRT